MEKIRLRNSGISAHVTIELTEAEAGALDALAGYGVDSFLQVFYTHMGKAYLQPYEAGLRSLFEYVRSRESGISRTLDDVREARRVLNGEKVAISGEAYARFEELVEKERLAAKLRTEPVGEVKS